MHAHQTQALPQSGSATEDPQKDMKRIGAAGLTGTLIEFYDLQIYSTAAALVFAHLFFPELGNVAGTVAAFGSIGVAFVARPIGSLVFGHFGDRLGRKKTLVISLLMMGISTVLVGLLPTGEQIGAAAPILLILLRIAQGLAAGGEFAGAALLVSENAPPAKRATWAALPQLGGAMALALAGLTFVITSLAMEDETFRAWGWRIPFLLSSALLVVGFYIRATMDETPVFAKAATHRGTTRLPLVEAIKSQPREILLGCTVQIPGFSLLYLVITYIVHFGADDLKLGYTEVLSVSVIAGFAMFMGTVIGSRLADRYGRKPVMLVGNGLAAVWVVALFPILHSGALPAYAAVVIVTMLISGGLFGPIGAFMSELFQTRYRYTAVGLCYNVSGIVGGAMTPMIAAPIVSAYGPNAFGATLAAIFLVSLGCCCALRETRFKSLDA